MQLRRKQACPTKRGRAPVQRCPFRKHGQVFGGQSPFCSQYEVQSQEGAAWDSGRDGKRQREGNKIECPGRPEGTRPPRATGCSLMVRRNPRPTLVPMTPTWWIRWESWQVGYCVAQAGDWEAFSRSPEAARRRVIDAIAGRAKPPSRGCGRRLRPRRSTPTTQRLKRQRSLRAPGDLRPSASGIVPPRPP